MRPSTVACAGIRVPTWTLLEKAEGSLARSTNTTSLPDFESLTPYQYVNVPLLSFGSTLGNCVGAGRSDNFGAVFEGWLLAPSEGTYTFSLTSDAGSRLVIDGFRVIDHDGAGSMEEKKKEGYF